MEIILQQIYEKISPVFQDQFSRFLKKDPKLLLPLLLLLFINANFN